MRKKDNFDTRWGFVLAAIGMALGTGNIWRFPRVVAANGGGSFIIAWTVALIVWSMPLLMAEMVLGRKTGLGCPGAFRDFVGRKFTWMGTWMGVVCLGIAVFYSVVMGWCLKYCLLFLTGAFETGVTAVETEAMWNAFLASPDQTILFHGVSVILAGVVVYKGVHQGIEKACKLIIPVLFVLLVIVAARALTLPGASQGVGYLFTPHFEDLAHPKVWLEAFTQSAWSTGAGWGFLIVYGVYTKKKDDIGLNCILTGLGNNAASLLAGLAVIPAIFALSATPEAANDAMSAGNSGLTFIYLASLFPTMPGGSIMGCMFFFAMTIAALSSLIAMYELGTRIVCDFNVSRKKAAPWVIIGCFVLGLPSAVKSTFLDNQDFVWGVALLISGLLCALAMMKYGVDKARTEIINHKWSNLYIGKWWNVCIWLFPLMFAFVFGWWMRQAFADYPDNWWSPMEPFSPGTMIMQWGVLITLALALNKTIAARTMEGYDMTEAFEEEEEAV